MKRNYFLPALFVAAAFSACTQEELVVNNATNDTFEAVGGKLLGDGFTANLNSGSVTRVGLDESGNAEYVEGDKAAIGWVIDGEVASDQTGVSLSEVWSTLYANHMLLHDGKGFNSHSNVYEGWHFAYRPYQYMKKPSILTVKVNPALEVAGTVENLKVDQYDNMPSFSNAAFVTETNVDEKTGMVDVKFPLQFIANAIRPVLNVDKKFTENTPFNGFAIKSITLSVGGGNDIFADELTVQPKGLNEILDAEGQEIAITEQYFGDTKAFKPAQWINSVTTAIKHDSYTLGEETNTVRMFLAPTKKIESGLSVEALSFRVDVDGGYFLIDANDADAVNKASIAMMKAMLDGGYTNESTGTKFDLTKLGNKIKTVPLNLTSENFYTKYYVKDYEGWKDCVTLANTLATEKDVEFVLAENADIKFDTEHPMIPTVANLTLKSNGAPKIEIDGEVTWPTTITGVVMDGEYLDVKVNDGAVLLLNSELRGQVDIYNYGTIKAECNAFIGAGLKNHNEVVVALGAQVSEHSSMLGKISYIVPENYDLAAIQAVIESAQVNNLVIGKGFKLECASPLALTGVHLAINGGTVSSEGYAVAAESVTLAGGSITGVDVTGDMTVKEGANATSYAGELNVGGNVTVEGKADLSMNNVSIAGALTNNGKVQISADLCTTIGSIENNGTLVATTDVYVETITLGESSATTINSGKTIWYSNDTPEFKQNGTTSGKIEYYNVATKFAADLAAAVEGDVVVLMQNETITDCSAIGAGVTIKGLSKDYALTIGGDNQMKFNDNVVIENLTIVGQSTYQDDVNYTDYDKYIVFAGDVEFNNVEFKTPVAVAGNATFNGCTFTGDDSYYMWIADYGKTINVQNCVFNSTRSITILDDFTVFGIEGTQARVNLNISGTTFNTSEKGAVMAGQAVSVTWGEGNVVPEDVVGKEVWIRYEYYKDTPNNIQNVKVTGCGINIEGA